MGKIKTEGKVTLEFDPYFYEISITVRAEGKTSGAAATAGKKQTEALLKSLRDDMGIMPEQLSAEDESVEMPRYSNNKELYYFQRTLLLKIPANNKLREAVTNLLADMSDVQYFVNKKLADESQAKRAVLDAAVQEARRKADQIAAGLQSSVVGFKEIFTDGTQNIMYDEPLRGVAAAGSAAPIFQNLASDLQNPKIKIDGTVSVTWLTEPLA